MADSREVKYDPLIELMARFENVKSVDTGVDPFEGLGVEDRLKKHIVDGIKKSLEQHLDDALESYEPLGIINEILLDGMKTVGELFGAGKMQLPFVLQSAETMKAAVRHLEPLMEKVEGSEKGSILLATVAGDVHDIGKNLVDIILSNNGYRVVNIGIKQPINSILAEAEANKCQVIGLSGLLVKSTLVMRDNLVEMNNRGLEDYPVILGGAALTRSYVEEDLSEIYKGRVFYAKDAFDGLRLMGELCGGKVTSSEDSSGKTPIPCPSHLAGTNGGAGGREITKRSVTSHRLPDRDPGLYDFDRVKSGVATDIEVPELPFYGAKKRTQFDINELYNYINPVALWRGQWQYKKPDGMSNPEFTDWLEENVRPIFERKCRELSKVLQPRVKWGYFWGQSEGNDLIIYGEDQKMERGRFNFPRQSDGKRLCLADFFKSTDSGVMDVVGFSIVTVGSEVSEFERKQFADGEFQEYLYTHGMGVETAEALAEYWHKMVRQEMGIGHEDPEEIRLLFSAKYHGARYSFGYPACPNLEDQTLLMELLQPQDIGIELSEEYMLVPEQSTSAIIVHHPEAKYFNIK